MTEAIEKFIPQHMAMWKYPDDYAGPDWHGWYIFLGQHRDSDDLAESNFAVGLAAVQAVMSKDPVPGDPDDCATVQVIRDNHWAVGWIENILIHESDEAALRKADELRDCIDNEYPVLDESDFSERETEHANTLWADCFNWKERIKYIREHESQFEFHDFADLMACVRGKYFSGYASELLQ